MIIDFSNLGASGGGSGSGSTVSWLQELSAGTEIAKITINGRTQNVYAPSGGSGSEIIQNYQIVSALTEVEGEESSVTYSGYTFDFSGVTVDTEGGITAGGDNIIADIAYKLSEGGAMYLVDTTTWEMRPIDDDNQWHNYYGDVFIKRNGSFVSVIFAGYTGEELVEFFNMETWEPSEEVVTGTTSDSIVAVVVLEGTVAYVTTDGKFYQYLDNDWVEMPDASAGQMRYTVSNENEMAALTSMSEGDVCVIQPSEQIVELNSESLAYNIIYGGFNLKGAIDIEAGNQGLTPDLVRFEVVENTYYGGENERVAASVLSPDWGNTYYGIKCETGGFAQVMSGSYSASDWQTASLGEFITVPNWGSVSTFDSANEVNLLNSESNPFNPYVFKVSVVGITTGGTYQYNEGQWIKLASSEDVASAMTQANQAYSLASSKLNDSSVQISTWGDFSGYPNGVYGTQVNNVDEGTRLHIYGTSTDYTNPRIDQIVTSDSFLRFMKMTQQEYDDLQTKDSNVCYIIVEEE